MFSGILNTPKGNFAVETAPMRAISSEKVGEKCGEGRGNALGRDSILLAACWDGRELGAREIFEKLINRV